MLSEHPVDVPREVLAKQAACEGILQELGSVLVAFSAGVDSTYLLALAVRTLGPERAVAGMGISPSLAGRERDAGRAFADQIGADLVEVDTAEMSNPAYQSNPADRCYHCKSELFCKLKQVAAERGLSTVVSGANFEDRGDFRPGLRAGDEQNVRNPLMEAGLTKAEIRLLSRALDLPTWDKPAMACLASRIPYGDAITDERLARVEAAEAFLNDLGFPGARVRAHDRLARIEVAPDQIVRFADETLRAKIPRRFRDLGFLYIALDLEGYRLGSLNETLDIR